MRPLAEAAGTLSAAPWRTPTGPSALAALSISVLASTIGQRIAFAAADVFLRINGWRLRRAPMQIYAEMMQMFDSGTFDIAHLDPWLRSFAVAAE